jgi:hypothetical protein
VSNDVNPKTLNGKLVNKADNQVVIPSETEIENSPIAGRKISDDNPSQSMFEKIRNGVTHVLSEGAAVIDKKSPVAGKLIHLAAKEFEALYDKSPAIAVTTGVVVGFAVGATAIVLCSQTSVGGIISEIVLDIATEALKTAQEKVTEAISNCLKGPENTEGKGKGPENIGEEEKKSQGFSKIVGNFAKGVVKKGAEKAVDEIFKYAIDGIKRVLGPKEKEGTPS